MRPRTVLPPSLALAPFRTSEAVEAGVRAARLALDDVSRPFRGLNVVGPAPEKLRARAEALVPLLRPGDAFSHTTAVALFGAPLPRPRDRRIHVTDVGGSGRFRRPGVAGHRAVRAPVTMLGTLPVVEPGTAWFQCASLLPHDDLVAVGDYLVTPRRVLRMPALASVEELVRVIPERARGAARARRALADIRIGAESPMETRLRLLLIRAGLPEPHLNPEVEGLHPDLLYPQWRLILEYEGDHHRTDPKQWRRDIWRREVFQAAGYRVMQVHAADVLAEPEHFLARVSRAIAQQQKQQQHPS